MNGSIVAYEGELNEKGLHENVGLLFFCVIIYRLFFGVKFL